MGPVTEDERNGLINHSPVYGKYEDDVDRESAYEMLQKGFQASIEQQNNPPVKGKEVAVDDGILGGLKDILFGTTGPRGGKKDGVVQTMAKSAARQVTNQIVRGMLGSLLGGEKKVSQVRFVFALMRRWRALSCQHHCNILNFHDFICQIRTVTPYPA